MVRQFASALAGIALAAALGGCSVLPEGGRNSQRQAMRPAQPAYVPSAAGRQCLSKLGADAASFTPLPDRFYGAGCSTLNTVRLSALEGDASRTFGIANLGPVACPLAETFSAWARYGVDRTARAVLKSPLERIETMGSYNCRNVAGSARRSAHATANAIDVSAFVLADGRRITVKGGWAGGSPSEKQFLRIVHTSACKRFGTVLGPGYNAAHQDHFHLEGSGKAFCR
ncbi:MAG: extensin family protein [Candidatus Andeanibacterium colombiense]|uniref:Extensin family protein n=1 Tax=Candidatus Andeanibacterium colombiense TaxID=3121345 RepID=A0AAJ5X2S8_9SPHN|nr:MAG: extensin family protein [Sphingomonadaceae bacterium]